MVKLLSILSLILALVLFPPAVLAVISNNAIPGDSTYPIKRSLEDIIFTMASINPTTKAWFSAARSDRRFKELTVLITQGKGATETLNELVEQTEVAASQIAQVSSDSQKQQLVEQLTQSIEKYDLGLQQLTNKDDTSNPPDSIPTQTSLPNAANLPTITSATPLPASPAPQQRTKSTPRAVASPTITPTPVPLPQTPTPTAQPTPSPRRENGEGRRHEERGFPSEIEETRKKLEEIKKKLRHEARGEIREKSEQENEHKDSSKEDKSSESNKRRFFND